MECKDCTKRSSCDPCGSRKKECCGNPCAAFSIKLAPNSTSKLNFSFNGQTKLFDFRDIAYQNQTDTTVSVDVDKRALIHNAERHIDTISAMELGSILHLADIGDINADGITQGSMLTYKKDSNCSEGCVGINNTWEVWNKNDNLTDSLANIYGSDKDGNLQALNAPANTNQHYQLSWAAGDKIKWKQPTEVATAPVDKDGKVYRLYLDPTTKEIVVVKEDK